MPPGCEAQWDGKHDFRLGATLLEASTAWAKRVGEQPADAIATVGQLLTWYQAHTVLAEKNPKTRTEKLRHIKRLRPVFDAVPVAGFKPAHVYGYVSRRGKLTVAHREMETLSHAFTKLVQKGDIDKHPFKGEVRLDGDLALKPTNRRYVEDWEIVELLALAPMRKKGSVRMIQAYIKLKLVTGLARSDLLRLRLDEHIKADGIHCTRHKTQTTPTIYDYTLVPERKQYVDEALAVRPALSPFLFCNDKGEGYFNDETFECHGWDSMWSRFMDRVLAETKITRRFTEHDLRRKAGSDAESLEKARALLQHADSATTLRMYRFKPVRV